MGRYGRRISRSLIGALIITLVLGLVFYLKNLGTTQAEQTDAQSLADAPHEITAAPIVANTAVQAVDSPPNPTPEPQIAIAAPTTKPAEPAAPPPTPNVIAEAQSKQAAGDLLGARKMLNEALLANSLAAADVSTAKSIIASINKDVVFTSRRFADDPFGGTYSVKSGDLLQKIATNYEITWEALMRLNNMTDPRKLRAGQSLKVIRGPFNAVVNKSAFTLDIYLGPPLEPGSMYVTTFKVGLGRDDSTPTGSWLVEPGKKLKNPTYYSARGEGIIDADDPKNPLGERWIGLTGIDGHALGSKSYGIHGTIDPNSIGKMESQGCIRLVNEDVEWVFDLLVEGKSIVLVKD